jgi:tetratricopeptide (TPR) repeat protein
MPYKVFISATTTDLQAHREEVARVLRRKGLEVVEQAHFAQGDHTLLKKLDDKIGTCLAAIFLVGDTFGDAPFDEQVNAHEHGVDFESIRNEIGIPYLSYTQWEYVLAKRKYKIPTYVFIYPSSDTKPQYINDRLEDVALFQKAYIKWMKKYGEDRNTIEYNSGEKGLGKLIEDVLVLPLPTLRTGIPFSIPFNSLQKGFIGRSDELKDLREHLTNPGNQIIATSIFPNALYGLGGIGKTRLAVEYAHRFKSEYAGLFFITSDTQASVELNLANLSDPKVLDLPEHQAREQEQKLNAVIQYLNEHKNWLLIFDNVDTPECALFIQKEIIPHIHNGHILITSRLSNWSGSVSKIELGLLKEEDALELLLRSTNDRAVQTNDNAQGLILVRELDRLAMAIEQAAAYINYRKISIEAYLKIWNSHHEKMLDWHSELSEHYRTSVLKTWKVTYDLLETSAKKMLHRLAWFAPDPIPASLLDTVIEGYDSLELGEAISELNKFSLLTQTTENGSSTFFVHRLVQDVTRQWQEKENNEEELREALHWIDDAYIGGSDDFRNWPVLEPLTPHALSLADFAYSKNITEPTSRLYNDIGLLYYTKAKYKESEPLMRRAWDIDEKNFGPEHSNVARDLNNLSALLQATNRLAEAEPLMRRALEIDEKSFGPEHPLVAIRLNNLAQLLKATNRLDEAEPLMRRALKIDEKNFGPEHPNVAIRLNNLALLLQATDRLDEAEPLMRRALEICEKSFGLEHPNVAVALNNLAQLLQATNRLDKAEPLMRRALQIDEKSFGRDHPKIAIRLNNLAQLLKATNRLAEAEPLMRRALEIDKKSLGPEHPNVAIRLNNLAALLQATDRLDEAEPLMRRALEIDVKSFGPEHPNVAGDLNNLAQLLKKTHRLDEAEPLMRRALKIDEKSFGPEHPDVAIDLNNLALLLQATNRLDEAEPLMRRALKIDEKSFGPEHPDVAIDLNNLARLLQDTNRLDEAEPTMRRALEIFILFTLKTSHQHPHLNAVLDNYKMLLMEMGKPQTEAEQIIHDLIEETKRKFAQGE